MYFTAVTSHKEHFIWLINELNYNNTGSTVWEKLWDSLRWWKELLFVKNNKGIPSPICKTVTVYILVKSHIPVKSHAQLSNLRTQKSSDAAPLCLMATKHGCRRTAGFSWRWVRENMLISKWLLQWCSRFTSHLSAALCLIYLCGGLRHENCDHPPTKWKDFCSETRTRA